MSIELYIASLNVLFASIALLRLISVTLPFIIPTALLYSPDLIKLIATSAHSVAISLSLSDGEPPLCR